MNDFVANVCPAQGGNQQKSGESAFRVVEAARNRCERA